MLQIIPKWNIKIVILNLYREIKRINTRETEISQEIVPNPKRIGHKTVRFAEGRHNIPESLIQNRKCRNKCFGSDAQYFG